MKDQFYILLPSNSSMNYFNYNTTARFVTQLPQPNHLTGSWNAALTEIHILMNFKHIPNEDDERIVALETRDSLSDPGENEVGRLEQAKLLIFPGVYQDVKELSVMNN